MASIFPAWVESEEDENLYIDAQLRGADGAILSTKRTSRRYLDRSQTSSGAGNEVLDKLQQLEKEQRQRDEEQLQRERQRDEDQRQRDEEQNKRLKLMDSHMQGMDAHVKMLAERSVSIIDDETRQRISEAVFALSLSEHFQAIGVLFFVSPTLAVTCRHNIEDRVLQKLVKNIGDFVWATNEKKRSVRLKVVFICHDHDLAVLSLSSPDAKVDQHLALLDTIPSTGLGFIVAAYNIGIREELPDFDPLTIGVAQGHVVKVSTNHFVYSSMTHAGDSGSALTLIGGNVVGMHLDGVNEARERHNKATTIKDRLTDAEQSIDSLVEGLSQGCIGLLAKSINVVLREFHASSSSSSSSSSQ